MSFRRQVGTGLFWVATATIATKALSLLRKLILARLLVPSDFGLVGYASLMLGVLGLFKEMGFSSALIYRKDDVDEAANTTFYAVIASGVLLYVLAFCAAPSVASFFRNDALVEVLRVLGLTLVLSSISQVPLTLMAKGMGFRKKVIPELIANVIGASVSVVLALMGYKVWAIVYGQLVTSVLLSVLVWFFSPWRPKLSIDRHVASELWSYGKHIIGSQLMVFAITNIDDAFIGRLLGDASLGTYQLSYDLSNLPATHLSRIVGQVMFPAFSRIQNDMQKLKRVFFQSMKFVSLAAIPIAIITMVFCRRFHRRGLWQKVVTGRQAPPIADHLWSGEVYRRQYGQRVQGWWQTQVATLCGHRPAGGDGLAALSRHQVERRHGRCGTIRCGSYL